MLQPKMLSFKYKAQRLNDRCNYMEDLIQKGQERGKTFEKLGGTIFFARKGGINLKRGLM